METTTAPHVYAAINAVQADLSKEGITKDRTNSQGSGYKFRGIDDIYNTLCSLLATHKLCILPRCTERMQEERATKAGGCLFYTTIRCDFDLVSAVDGSKHTITLYGEAMDSSDKSTNKAMSAAYKYACLQAFCIPTEGDNDADATTHEPVARQQQSRQYKVAEQQQPARQAAPQQRKSDVAQAFYDKHVKGNPPNWQEYVFKSRWDGHWESGESMQEVYERDQSVLETLISAPQQKDERFAKSDFFRRLCAASCIIHNRDEARNPLRNGPPAQPMREGFAPSHDGVGEDDIPF